MTDYYVNKSGLDTNDGLGPATAFLTISAAVTAATSGDRIIVQSGVYSENVQIGFGFNNPLTFLADGLVILDGQGSLARGFQGTGSSTGYNITTLNDKSYWIIRNFTLYGLERLGGGFGGGQFIENIRFEDNNRGVQEILGTGQVGKNSPNIVRNCVFVGNQWGIRVESGQTQGRIEKCTFYDNSSAGIFRGGFGGFEIEDCIFHRGSATLLMDHNSGFLWSGRNDWYFDGVAAIRDTSNVDHTTLPSWQDTSSGHSQGQRPDRQSIDTDPMFLDAAKRLFRLDKASNALTAGSNNTRQGAYDAGIAISNNVNNAAWTSGATLINVTLNANNDYEITTPGSIGTVETGIIDLGAAQTAAESFIESLITYPADVLDHDKTDTQPNRLTYEIRASNSAGPIAAAYEPVEIGANVASATTSFGTAFRYWQVKMTLRDDGVAA